ncbi:MAG: cysteine desulfurase, partial [Bdellovibrionales bacterium]|nr:cysteine desulfurase [Bdellovibrionales bacterium]
AASTLKPQVVIDALTNHYTFETANIHRGVHYLSDEGTTKYEESRSTIKEFINAKYGHEVIFTGGTTDSINLVAQTYGRQNLRPGDEILISTMEHHSNIVPWQIVAQEKSAIVKEIPIDENGDILVEEYKKLLNKKTKIVAITHTSNTMGTINPIKELIKYAHQAGAIFLVDAAQSVAHTKVDVQSLNCDFLVFSAHKIYGPTGIGIMYGKEDLLNSMPPYRGGGNMIERVSIESSTYNELPHKFEAGTPHIAGGIAFKDAINYIKDIGIDNIESYEEELRKYATEQLQQINNLKIIGTSKKKSSILSFDIKGVHPHDLGTLLDRQGIAVRTGHHCTQPLMKRYNLTATTRASFSFYNTKEEIDLLVAGIKKSLTML